MKRSLEQLDEVVGSGDSQENVYAHDRTADEHITTRRKSSSGSDFSTFEISRALRAPSPPPLPSHLAPDPASQKPEHDATQTAVSGASSKVLFVDPVILEDLTGVLDLHTALKVPFAPSAPRCRGLQPLPHLQELLDFSQLNTPDWTSYRFCQIAYSLLHHHRIEISTHTRTERLEILDIEFYLFKSGCHEDPYTHRSYEQSRSGLWYFHRLESSERDRTFGPVKPDYLSGVQAGLDLTFGQPADSVRALTSTDTLRGGILIRSVLRVSDGKVIHRPFEVVDEVLRLSDACTIRDLTVDSWNCNISAFPPSATTTSTLPLKRSSMYLVRTMPSSVLPITKRDMVVSDGTRRIFRSARVELELSSESSYALESSPAIGSSQTSVQLSSNSASVLTRPDVQYFAAPYRFFVAPYLLHLRSTPWPRAQNFLGVHDGIMVARHGEDAAEPELLLKEISRLTGLKFAQRYLTAFRQCRAAEEQQPQNRPDSDVVPGTSSSAPASKGLTKKNMISDSAVEWLRVIATIRSLRAQQEPQTSSLANEFAWSGGSEHLSSRRKSSSASDFSAFDISQALGTPPPLPAPLSITIHSLPLQHFNPFLQPMADITTGFPSVLDIPYPDLEFFEQDFSVNFDLPPFALADFEPCEPLAPFSQSTQAQVEDVRDSIPDLAALLDFCDVNGTDSITFRFIQIAYYLLHHHRIEIRTATDTERLEILEVEFYLYKAGSHEDPYTHGSVEQGCSGQWCASFYRITLYTG
ncbi:hypothetical protein C8Q80DRAFT_305021 [Daedaleopsis nitida]|nr:hypothetical protein C8Q80DRAFT_305021 [Daedaleopsis nitida]